MELQQLRYVLAVAEERNFTRAAARCHVVQSALSHQIKSLERELGVQLFARTSRRVELSAAGTAFLPAAQATLDAADRAVAEAAAAVGELRGTLTIGTIPTVTAVDLSAALGEFHRDHPQVRIRMRTGSSHDFVDAIREGGMDVAILGLPGSEAPMGVSHEVLARERHVAVMAPGHRLARRRRLRLAELVDETFVHFPERSPGRAQSDIAFAAAGFARHVPFETMATDVLLDLVAQDLAIALLPPAIVRPELGLVTVPVVGGPTRTEYVAWSEFNPRPAALACLDRIRAYRNDSV